MKTTNTENEWQSLRPSRFHKLCPRPQRARQLTLPDESIQNASAELFRYILADQVLADKSEAARKAVSEVARWAERLEANIKYRERWIEFRRLAMEWKKETSHISSIQQRSINMNYQRIIGMGAEAVPLILEEMKHHPDDWFWALYAITGENPVPAESQGRVREMTDAWLQWGRTQGYEV